MPPSTDCSVRRFCTANATMSSGLNVTICGGGNGVHAMAGLVPATGWFSEVNILSIFPGEGDKFNKAAATQGGEVHVTRCKDGPKGEDIHVNGKPTKITGDPSVVANSDVIVFVVPAFAHGGYLEAIKPFVRTSGSKAPGGRVLVGAMPGGSGFDIQAQSILGGEIFNNISLFALETLPWAVRLTEYGKSADILGTKLTVDMAVTPTSMGKEVTAVVQHLMGQELPRLRTIPSQLAITLSLAYWHPTITWGCYRLWDGKTPFDKPPLFYEGADQATGVMLCKISDEVDEMKKVLETQYKLDLTGLHSVTDWILRTYGDDIADKSCLHRMMNTNKGYQALTHPMLETGDGKLMPNFKYRYLSEDVPMGMVVTRGIAELLGVPTPNMDTIIHFASEKLGKSYLVNGKVAGPDVKSTRSPQAFGITSIDDFIKKLRY